MVGHRCTCADDTRTTTTEILYIYRLRTMSCPQKEKLATKNKNCGNSYTCIWTGLSLFGFIHELDNERHGDSCGDSGTVWLAFALGRIVVGDDVCCFVGSSCGEKTEHVRRWCGHVEISPSRSHSSRAMLEKSVMTNILVQRTALAHCPIIERLSFPLVALGGVASHVGRVHIPLYQRRGLEELERYGTYSSFERATIHRTRLREEDTTWIEQQCGKEVGGGLRGNVHERETFHLASHRLHRAILCVAVVKTHTLLP